MEKKVSAEQFYTAGIGAMTIFLIVVFGFILLYEKVIKDNKESSYGKKRSF